MEKSTHSSTPVRGPRELFESHFSFVWRNLRRLGLDPNTADDAAQEVFLVVHRRFDSYDARWSSVETWLFGILLRVAKTHQRSWLRYERWLDRSRSSDEPDLRSLHQTPEHEFGLKEKVQKLELILDQLSTKERELFVMVEIEQFSVAEAAEALGVNANTAYSRLRKARAKVSGLVRSMKDKNHDTPDRLRDSEEASR